MSGGLSFLRVREDVCVSFSFPLYSLSLYFLRFTCPDSRSCYWKLPVVVLLQLVVVLLVVVVARSRRRSTFFRVALGLPTFVFPAASDVRFLCFLKSRSQHLLWCCAWNQTFVSPGPLSLRAAFSTPQPAALAFGPLSLPPTMSAAQRMRACSSKLPCSALSATALLPTFSRGSRPAEQTTLHLVGGDPLQGMRHADRRQLEKLLRVSASLCSCGCLPLRFFEAPSSVPTLRRTRPGCAVLQLVCFFICCRCARFASAKRRPMFTTSGSGTSSTPQAGCRCECPLFAWC